jgi:AraC family transcriptional regulator
MAVRDGDIQPLYDAALQGPYSPSPSLLIERHELRATDWQTVIIPEQLLTLHLRRSVMEYEDGAGRCYCQSRARGGVVIEKRGCAQRFRWNSSISTLTVRLSDAVLEQALQGVPLVDRFVPADSAGQDMRLSALLFSLERERLQGYPSGRLFLDGIEQALAAIVIRYEGVGRNTVRLYKGGLAPYRMKRVTEFIRAHIEEEITLNELARDVGLSPSHFCSLFRKTSGMTPHQFVLNCRIQHAKTLLSKSGHSILDVALASGFRTHQHFSRIFRRHVGMPPSTYRSQL